MHVITKREKMQYAYVFLTDLLALTVSVLLSWLITDGVFNVLVPYTGLDADALHAGTGLYRDLFLL